MNLFDSLKKTKELSFADVIKARRSVRRFTGRKVGDNIILGALDAALWAPSAGNVQDREFIIVKDAKAKESLIPALYDQVWVARAPVIIIIISDINKMRLKFIERSEFYSTIGAGFAIENILLYLASIGLQGTTVGLFDEVHIKRLMKVPDAKRVFGVIAIGYPAELPPTPVRAELKNITSIESYDNKWVKHVPKSTFID
ncbi:MAG: nitroreductase family protein [Candidatus Nanoarchaeia archaeon]|jgi:nitroreductase